MTTQKVFEFAKEIGVETLTLMDKIRKWGLPIKSHMADLDADLMTEIRTKLEQEGAGADGKKKVTKKVTKKAAAAKPEVVADADGEAKEKRDAAAAAPKVAKTTKAPAVAKSAAKVATKTTVKKNTGGLPSLKAEAAAAAKIASSKTVIRRKKADLEEEAALAAAAAAEAKAEAEAEVTAAALITEEVAPEVVEASSPLAAAAEATAEAGGATTAAPDATVVTAAPVAAGPGAARKREILMTEDGPISGVRSVKRNIVGRMDLNRVSQLPQARAAKTQNRSNLRTGFVTQEVIPDMPTPVDAFDDRKDKKKKGMPAGPTKEKEVAPPTFVQADYMKREIVFQPKKKKIAEGPSKKPNITVPKASKRIVKVYGTMSVNELGQSMGVKATVLIKALMGSGIVATINTSLDFDTIALLAPEFKFEAQNVKKSDVEMVSNAAFSTGEEQDRSPIVTVMGHVDHGKTTLLDSIRKARVAAGEAGGITQHIGAYRVKTSLGEVTFIDTPGHEAFTAMRQRGATATDIVILVVAADDGVMPQTIEAISHAKAANVPIIVAVNKMDKPGANPDRVKQQLAEYELLPEDWGGSTQFVPVSALKNEGVQELLDQISVLAEVLELKANPDRSATGIVIESRVEKGRGNVATMIVQDGTLKLGQPIVIGTIATKVRMISDENGKAMKEAGPSMPVEIAGLPGSPNAGDRFDICKDEKSAEEIARSRQEDIAKSQEHKPMNLEDLFSKIKAGDVKELPIILKTDVAGSTEAIKGLFSKVSTSEVKIKIIHSAVGAISESDILLASTTKGIVVGFNVRPDTGAQQAAKNKGVEIKTYSIVYELVDDMKKALAGLLAPEIREKVLGRVQVRNVFTVPKAGTIAGSFVTDGTITRNASCRLIREGKVIYTGKLSSLKRFKDDAREVAQGFECGVGIENYNDIKVGDEIEAFTQESIVREL